MKNENWNIQDQVGWIPKLLVRRPWILRRYNLLSNKVLDDIIFETGAMDSPLYCCWIGCQGSTCYMKYCFVCYIFDQQT